LKEKNQKESYSAAKILLLQGFAPAAKVRL